MFIAVKSRAHSSWRQKEPIVVVTVQYGIWEKNSRSEKLPSVLVFVKCPGGKMACCTSAIATSWPSLHLPSCSTCWRGQLSRGPLVGAEGGCSRQANCHRRSPDDSQPGGETKLRWQLFQRHHHHWWWIEKVIIPLHCFLCDEWADSEILIIQRLFGQYQLERGTLPLKISVLEILRTRWFLSDKHAAEHI